MFDVVNNAESDLVISLPGAEITCEESLSFGFSVPLSFEWLTIRDAAQSCYDWIEDAASAALYFTIRVSSFAQRCIARVRAFFGSRRDLAPRLILRRLRQLRL